MSKTYAISTASSGYQGCSLWCTGRKYSTGTLSFSVINGQWDGQLRRDGTLVVKDTGEKFKDCRLVWEGVVPSPYNTDYNEAIRWINTQLGLL